MGRGFWAASALLAAWMCAPPLAAATLPPSTLSALHNLWAATGGPSWTRCSAWTPGFDPCVQPWGIPEWTPPDEGNAIDVVPGWGREICFVCENNGSGLKGLNFVLNNMTGPLPASIGAFPRLAYLSLLDNHLEGPLPPALGNLTALTQLYMGHNDFVGGIPPELGRLSALTVLYINGNNLVGELPPELGNLTLLSQLGLTNNRLGGALPSALAAVLSPFLTLSLSLKIGLSVHRPRFTRHQPDPVQPVFGSFADPCLCARSRLVSPAHCVDPAVPVEQLLFWGGADIFGVDDAADPPLAGWESVHGASPGVAGESDRDDRAGAQL